MNLLGKIGESSGENTLKGVDNRPYKEIFWDKFNLFVGIGKRFSPAEIAAASGVPIKTINKYNQKIQAASVENLRRLCMVMPFEFRSWAISYLGGNDIIKEIRSDYAEVFEVLTNTESFEALLDKIRKGQL